MIPWPNGIRTNIYSSRYEKLILFAKNRIFPENSYGEVHHILPISLGGEDTTDNKVKLYPREHYLAHLLLWKMDMLPKMHNKMSMALHVMINGSGNKKQKRNYIVSSKIYEKVRESYIIAMKKHFAEHGGTFKGKKHTPESIKKIKEANHRTKEYRQAYMLGEKNPWRGKHHSEETKKIMSEKNKNWWTEDNKQLKAKLMKIRWENEDWKKEFLEKRHNSQGWKNRNFLESGRKSAQTKKLNGWKHSKESIEKMKLTRKNKIASGEIISWNKGKKMPSTYIHPMSKLWEIIDPLGNKHIVHGKLHQFCKDQNIGYDSLRNLVKGQKGRNKLFNLGWQAKIINSQE